MGKNPSNQYNFRSKSSHFDKEPDKDLAPADIVRALEDKLTQLDDRVNKEEQRYRFMSSLLKVIPKLCNTEESADLKHQVIDVVRSFFVGGTFQEEVRRSSQHADETPEDADYSDHEIKGCYIQQS